MRTRAAVLTVVLVAEALVGAQQRPRETPRTGEPYTAATTAILVDVVVRDKRGRPVTDLTKDDFEVFEDDVPQSVGSFSVVVARQRHRHPGSQARAGHDDGVDAGSRLPSRRRAKTDERPPTTAHGVRLAHARGAQPGADGRARGASDDRRGARAASACSATEPGLRLLQPYTGDLALVRVGRPPRDGRRHRRARTPRPSGARRSTTGFRQLDALSGAVGIEAPAAFGPSATTTPRWPSPSSRCRWPTWRCG